MVRPGRCWSSARTRLDHHLAAGLASDGRVDTVEPNDELNAIQDEFWEKRALAHASTGTTQKPRRFTSAGEA